VNEYHDEDIEREDDGYPGSYGPNGPEPWEKISAFWHRHRLAIVLISVFLIGSIWFIYQIQKGLPTLDQLENPHPEMATRIISADGEPIDQFYIKNRTTVKLREVPKALIDALIATEDRDFYAHWGVDIWGTFRAVWKDVVTLSPRQGASTITQQLARNLYLSQEKTALRKLQEAISAVQIERSHTKNEILEMYLNVCYLGRGAYGVAVASQVYFAKDVSKLTPAQCAFLVGILKGPENYDPEDNYDRAIARRNTVVENMVDAGYLEAGKAEKMKQEPIKVQPQKGYQGIAPHFVEMVRQELSKKPELAGYDLYRDGLVVYTTLNADMQRAANRALDEHISFAQKEYVDKPWKWPQHKELLDSLVTNAIRHHGDYKTAEGDADKAKIAKKLRADQKFIDSVKKADLRLQASFVCIDPKTGQILAMIGSSNYREDRYGLNRVTQIIRQPGSAFKPFVYASCFEKGYTPESIVSNEQIEMKDGDKIWRPKNSGGEVGGAMPIKTAIQFSVNLCAIHAILEMTNARDVVALAKRMGVKSNLVPAPSLALGTSDVSPLEITSAFSVFANNGIRAVPYYILRVEDRNGKVLYRSKPEFEYVFDQKIAQMMTTCLQSVVESGTASRIRNWFSYPAAGKTGTTQSYADAWFVGYTPHYVAGVWVGFDDKRVTFTSANGQGGRAAAPIWGRFMKYAYQALKPKFANFNTDYNGIPQVPIDSSHKDSSDKPIQDPGPKIPSNEDKRLPADANSPGAKDKKDGQQ
jgi:penicillin-binding protein 1A